MPANVLVYQSKIVSIYLSAIGDYTLYKKFLSMTGSAQIGSDQIIAKMKKKRHLPLLFTTMEKFKATKINIFENRTLSIIGDSTT